MAADLFYIVLFLTAFGSIAWSSVILTQHILKIRIPFPFCSLMMLFYLVPLFRPGLKLVAEDPDWIRPYLTAAVVWGTGFFLSVGITIFRTWFAYAAIRKYAPCRDACVLHALQSCAERLRMRRVPEILYGDLKEPACVLAAVQPRIILSRRMVQRWSEPELAVILTHELVHIRRKHLFLQKCFDLIVCIHWFNPLAWTARREFSIACEMDCDQTIFRTFPQLSAAGYAGFLLRMMKQSMPNRHKAAGAIGSLDFLLARRRFQNILFPPSAIRKCGSVLLSLAVIVAVVSASLVGSARYFYPSSAGTMQIERSMSRGSY
ncbi:MAG TPA: hypothetical protein DC013_07170 [Ruminococcaceae bacterium]|jgi:beta-lactamase regulating signal transducer with metallopeptidase domain|nr:hypothetical protein [Oscillospiraceae bacterium]